jgi:uncharacterized protein
MPVTITIDYVGNILELWLTLILAGLAAGFMAGLLGIGGGFIVVPVLVWVLPFTDINEQYIPHYAIGTSLLCICITAMSSTFAHHRRGSVIWAQFKLISPGLIIGSLLGAALASSLNGTSLIAIFVSGAFATGIYLLANHQPKPLKQQSHWLSVIFAHFCGALSALMGIGGGSILVPFLVYRGTPMVKAVATAAACGLPIALFGATGYAISGWNISQAGSASIGFLYLPAALAIVVFSSLSAPWGAKVAHLISAKRLRQTFAIFLFFTGGQILYSHWF